MQFNKLDTLRIMLPERLSVSEVCCFGFEKGTVFLAFMQAIISSACFITELGTLNSSRNSSFTLLFPVSLIMYLMQLLAGFKYVSDHGKRLKFLSTWMVLQILTCFFFFIAIIFHIHHAYIDFKDDSIDTVVFNISQLGMYYSKKVKIF